MQNDKFLHYNVEKIISSPDEKVLFAIRQHSFVFVERIVVVLSFFVVFFIALVVFFVLFPLPPPLMISIVLLLIWGTITLITKIFLDWHCHSYIITTQKIVELRYELFFSEKINDILLDQVRCTEVLVEQNGLLNRIVNKGNIIILFDMPTHQDEFYFFDIAFPQEAGMVIGNLLSSRRNDQQRPIWYRYKNSALKHYNSRRR